MLVSLRDIPHTVLSVLVIPPGNTASVGAVLFHLPALGLQYFFSAAEARHRIRSVRVSADMGFYGIDGQAERIGYFGCFLAIKPHLRDGVENVLFHHIDFSFRKSCLGGQERNSHPP